MIEINKNAREQIMGIKIVDPFSFEELEGISKNTPMLISIEIPMSFVRDISKLKKLFGMMNCSILKITWDNEKELLSEEEMKILNKLNKKMKGNISFTNGFENLYTYDQAMIASSKIHEWADKINKASYKGKPLSPFEKYLYAYRIVTKFTYRQEYEHYDAESSRDLIKSLSGKYMVCVGFAKTLKALCDEIGIACEVQDVKAGSEEENHANCCVYIKDDKYNLDGIYYSDATWDCNNGQGISTINYILLRYDELSKTFGDYVKISESERERVFKSVLEKADKFKSLTHKNYSPEEIDRIIKEEIDKRFNELIDKQPENAENIQEIPEEIIDINSMIDSIGWLHIFEGQQLRNSQSNSSQLDEFRKKIEKRISENYIRTGGLKKDHIKEMFSEGLKRFNIDERFGEHRYKLESSISDILFKRIENDLGLSCKNLSREEIFKALVQASGASKNKNPESSAENILQISEEHRFNPNSQNISQTIGTGVGMVAYDL